MGSLNLFHLRRCKLFGVCVRGRLSRTGCHDSCSSSPRTLGPQIELQEQGAFGSHVWTGQFVSQVPFVTKVTDTALVVPASQVLSVWHILSALQRAQIRPVGPSISINFMRM